MVKTTGTTTAAQIIQIDDNNSNATGNPLHINYSALQLINSYSGASPSANGTKVAKLALNTVTTSGYAAAASIMCVAGGTGYNSGVLAFNTGSNNQNLETERMRINQSGNLYINHAGASQLTGRLTVYNDTSQDAIKTHQATSGTTAVWSRIDHTASYFSIFRYGASTTVGSITTNGSSTTYGNSSDYRLKENVSYDFDATSRLKQLKPARFNFIADETDTVVDGFLAHEVSSVVPEAINGEKDAVDADGNIDLSLIHI